MYKSGKGPLPATQTGPAGTWREVLSKICAAPTVSTPGRVQPGNGAGRSWAPSASTTRVARTTSARPLQVM
ncbi:hypothetical protein LMG3481_06195 [Achromobacter deleyi]|nr:hypothetical protein LMG3481_06195 [Achromobacter deleyi]